MSVPLSGLSQGAMPIPFPAFPQLQQFLGLTDTQVTALLQNNAAYNKFSAQQQQLIRNAQAEIATQTAKEQLDPVALGTLYAGIESACRDLRDRATASRQQNLSVLTDAQKARLNTLSDALKLIPVISEAQSGNLFGSANSAPLELNAFSLSRINPIQNLALQLQAPQVCGDGGANGGISGGVIPG